MPSHFFNMNLLQYSTFVFLTLFSSGALTQSQDKEVVTLKKLGRRHTLESYNLPPILIKGDSGVFIINVANTVKDKIYHFNEKTNKIKSFSIRPIFDYLSTSPKEILILTCATYSNNHLYIIDTGGILIFKLSKNKLILQEKLEWPSTITPYKAFVKNNILFVTAHILWKNIYTTWEIPLKNNSSVVQNEINDKQAMFSWCGPNKRIENFSDSLFLYSECTKYIVKKSGIDESKLDTLFDFETSNSLSNDLTLEWKINGKFNCQRLNEIGKNYLNGIHFISDSLIIITIRNNATSIRRDYVEYKNSKWKISNSVQIYNPLASSSFDVNSFIYTLHGPDESGVYLDSQKLLYSFDGPKNLPNGVSKEKYEQGTLKKIRNKKIYNYMIIWKLK